MFLKGLQSRLACHQSVTAINVNHEKGAQTGDKNCPEQCHAIVGPGFGHGCDTAGPNIKTQQEYTGQKEGQYPRKFLTEAIFVFAHPVPLIFCLYEPITKVGFCLSGIGYWSYQKY